MAFDEAFHFYYPDNLELLAAAGIATVRFSPLRDRRLPPDLDGLWLGGGYPEEHAAALARNAAMREAVRQYAAAGGRVYAECGGLMYLARRLADRGGRVRPMAGVLPLDVRMLPRRKRLGYAEVTLRRDGPFGPAGARLRGHEFHYSEVTDRGRPAGWRPAYTVAYRDGRTAAEGYWNGRVLASYVHLHLGSRRAAAPAFARFLGGDRA
jgi:cobyrinic acid a,c-diamide synthase